MIPINRFLALTLAFLILSSSTLLLLSVTAPTVYGQENISKPSIPQFTVKIIGDYYYVPPSTTTSIDKYTGEEITTTKPGYYKDERNIAVVIKNQPFKPYTDKDGNQYNLYYKFQCKGHFEDEWHNTFLTTLSSSSDYTTVISMSGGTVPKAGSQIDYRVEAIIGQKGNYDTIWGIYDVYFAGSLIIYGTYRDVVSSGWSEAVAFIFPAPGEAITLPPTNTSPVDPPILTPESSVSDDFYLPPSQQTPWATYLLIITTVCLITIPIVAILAYHYGQRKNKPYPNNPSNSQFTEIFKAKEEMRKIK